jgi:hypothetical protein
MIKSLSWIGEQSSLAQRYISTRPEFRGGMTVEVFRARKSERVTFICLAAQRSEHRSSGGVLEITPPTLMVRHTLSLEILAMFWHYSLWKLQNSLY